MVNETGSQNETKQRDLTVLTDRADVRIWADEHDVVPVRREGTDRIELVHTDDVRSDDERYQWSDFLEAFERRDLALVSRESATDRDRYRLVDRSQVVDERGEPVIESELVDSQLVDSEVVETELIEEELIGVALVETADAEVIDDHDRQYFDDEGAVEAGLVVLEIEETRRETEDQLEKQIIESRVAEQDVNEDTVATSTLTERRTVDNEIEEHKVLFAEVTAVDIDDSRVVGETVLDSEIVDSDVDAVADRHSEVETMRERRTEEGTTAGPEEH